MEVFQVIKNLMSDLKGQIPDPDYCTMMFKIMALSEENIRITLVENEAFLTLLKEFDIDYQIWEHNFEKIV